MLVDVIEAEMATPSNEMDALYKACGGDHDLSHWVKKAEEGGQLGWDLCSSLFYVTLWNSIFVS